MAENFWKYCKETFEGVESILLSFDERTCHAYFRKILTSRKTNRNFELPSWLKTQSTPTAPCNLMDPSDKLRSAASPCPLDQMNAIMLKRCPFFRTMLHKILSYCWKHQRVPKAWKQGLTILIHKKGENSDPSNFRPITLQPVFAKVYSSLIRNRLYTFLIQNKYIESNIQKGFWEGVSGTVEHTELLTHMINHARVKQRNMVVTLLDSKNAFGEVEHNLIMKILDYHHVPDEIKSIIREYYRDYTISISTKDYVTDPVIVGKGVLQGDCLSLLLFNICFNSLLKCIDDEQIKCVGYVYSDAMTPRHWFQFADDSTIATATDEDSQHLLNVFTKWCQWSCFAIRIDKCKSFGIKKNGRKSVQYKPYLRISGQMIPCVEIDDVFIYLEKTFSFYMSCENIKKELSSMFSEYLEKLNNLPLHPNKKLKMISMYVYSKIRWKMSIYDLSVTWVIQSMDSLLKTYVKRWLHMHQRANFDHLKLPPGNWV